MKFKNTFCGLQENQQDLMGPVISEAMFHLTGLAMKIHKSFVLFP